MFQGVEKAGFHILILFEPSKIYLVPPTVPAADQLWKGTPDTHQQLLEKYDVDGIITEEELPSFIYAINPSTIYSLITTNTSVIPHHFTNKVDKTVLQSAINEARLTKSEWEIDLLRRSAHVSSHAHISLMQHIMEVESEAELEARFRWMCARNGLNRQCYIPIIASGPRAAVLHYTDNDKMIPKTQHSLVLVDAGGEGRCYGSDITRTFPATGKFSKEATTIYNIVLKAQKAVIKKLRPGIYWRDMHNLVVRTLTEELVRIGILIGDVDTLIELEIYRTFYFHGKDIL
jgi:Xaa-Pro dipeptidase